MALLLVVEIGCMCDMYLVGLQLKYIQLASFVNRNEVVCKLKLMSE